ncbi:MAG: PepSY-like domain-containing protein [Muribaculaceae bacterium]|nr:PepSY-like domain-containing protein [Muribaculaceae bacterium]
MKYALKHFAAIAVVMLSAAFVWNCSDDDKDVPVDMAALPANAKAFISAHYTDVSVVSAIRDRDDGRDEYEVRFSNGHEVTFDAAGEWIDVEAPAGRVVPDGLVPEAVALYVVTNYPSEGINEISRSAAGYDVDLTNGVDLEFDPLGNFLRVDR